MRSVVQSIYLDSRPGALTELDPAGTSLEHPYVYDSAARELKAMADRGLVEIVRGTSEEMHGRPRSAASRSLVCADQLRRGRAPFNARATQGLR